jgi:hypothetical protein
LDKIGVLFIMAGDMGQNPLPQKPGKGQGDKIPAIFELFYIVKHPLDKKFMLFLVFRRQGIPDVFEHLFFRRKVFFDILHGGVGGFLKGLAGLEIPRLAALEKFFGKPDKFFVLVVKELDARQVPVIPFNKVVITHAGCTSGPIIPLSRSICQWLVLMACVPRPLPRVHQQHANRSA